MIKKLFLPGLLVLAVALLSWPYALHAQEETGSDNFLFVNYIGQPLYLDLDDVQYIVPGTDTMPDGGRLSLTLAPGEHKYAANVPGVEGSAGEFLLAAGQTVSKAARFEETAPVVREGVLVEKPRTYVFVFDFEPMAEAAASPAPTAEPWQPRPATAGQSSVVWTNHTGYELNIDLNGQIYKVPPKANDVPGRLQSDISPGDYTYTVSVPNGGLNGRFTAAPGQVTGFVVTADLPPAPDYDIGEEFELLPAVTLRLFQEDLTGQTAAAPAPVMSASESLTGTMPAAPAEAAAAQPAETPASETGSTMDGLLVRNFAGDTMVFTIDNQAYFVAPNAELSLPLAPGQYSYTASIPAVAKSGTVAVGPGQPVELSIVINSAKDALSIYQQ